MIIRVIKYSNELKFHLNGGQLIIMKCVLVCVLVCVWLRTLSDLFVCLFILVAVIRKHLTEHPYSRSVELERQVELRCLPPEVRKFEMINYWLKWLNLIESLIHSTAVFIWIILFRIYWENLIWLKWKNSRLWRGSDLTEMELIQSTRIFTW